MVSNPIGPGCSLCYLSFSCCSVFMLIILALVFYPGQYTRLGAGDMTADEARQYAATCYYTAAFYGGCFFLCTIRYVQLYFQEKRKNPYVV